MLQNPHPDGGVGDRTAGPMCIYLHQTTTTDSDPLQSAPEAGAWARRAPALPCSERCTLQSTAEELLLTTTSILHSFICRPHMKSSISLSIHHCNSMSTHFSLVGQAQWLGVGRSPSGASSPDGATSMQASFSSTPLPLSSLSNASSSVDARARHHCSGRAHIGVSPWPRARAPHPPTVAHRARPPPAVAARLAWRQDAARGRRLVLPASRSKLPLRCTVRTRASLAETRGCQVVQSRSRPFFMLQSNVPCVPDIREGCCKRSCWCCKNRSKCCNVTYATLMLQVSNLDVAFFIDMFHVDLNVTHNINRMLRCVSSINGWQHVFHNFLMLQMLSFHVVDTFFMLLRCGSHLRPDVYFFKQWLNDDLLNGWWLMRPILRLDSGSPGASWPDK
jgi:hypothetical protein